MSTAATINHFSPSNYRAEGEREGGREGLFRRARFLLLL